MTKRTIKLRDVAPEDLPIFFKYQLDEDANYMAAFTAKDPRNRAVFDAHWAKILSNDEVIIQTILLNGKVVGSVLSYVMMGEREISYWIGKSFWGMGIATGALSQYLKQVSERPLHARVVKDNIGSLRVLEKCGFKITGEDTGFANARGGDVEEWLLMLG